MKLKESIAINDLLKNVEKQPQRQDSLIAQLKDLIVVANKLGMYNASEYIELRLNRVGI